MNHDIDDLRSLREVRESVLRCRGFEPRKDANERESKRSLDGINRMDRIRGRKRGLMRAFGVSEGGSWHSSARKAHAQGVERGLLSDSLDEAAHLLSLVLFDTPHVLRPHTG